MIPSEIFPTISSRVPPGTLPEIPGFLQGFFKRYSLLTHFSRLLPGFLSKFLPGFFTEIFAGFFPAFFLGITRKILPEMLPRLSRILPKFLPGCLSRFLPIFPKTFPRIYPGNHLGSPFCILLDISPGIFPRFTLGFSSKISSVISSEFFFS